MSSLSGRIAEHTRCQPHEPALIWRREAATYGELAAMAQAVRAQLDALSPGPVGIFTHKSPAAIGLIFGCLLAGRRVLIPSASASNHQLGTLFDQAGCAHVLSVDPDLALRHPDLIDLVVDVTPTTGPLAAPAAADPEAISYLLTTSGSTGSPKIVPLTAGAMDRFAVWAAGRFDLRPGCRVLNYAPLNFDLCLLDIWATLAHGGCVVLVEADHATNGAYLADLLTDNQVEVAQAVPMYYEILAETARRSGTRFGSVRHVLITGDTIRDSCLAELPGLFPAARLSNVYGCTETNDSFLADATGLTRGPLPLGSPLPGVHSLLVGDDGSVLSGPGSGELYVSTPFQTPGYLAGAGEEKFAVRTVEGVARRYFRSGDLVRRHADGKLTLVGRTDFRVKVRGQQVDIQQVEQVLINHECVIEAVTVVVPDPVAGQRLHAMVRRAPGSQLNSLILRRYCADRLHMSAIPSTVQIVDTPLPRTATGKVDRVCIRNSQLKGKEVDHAATVTQYIVDEFLPDLSAAELAPDYDLLAGGVIDSLALLRVIAWLGDRFDLPIDDIELRPDDFRTVNDISDFIRAHERADARVDQCAGY